MTKEKEFKDYLYQYTKDVNEYQTHLSLIGGKYNVSDDYYDDFYERYFSELSKGTKMYLVEKVKDSKFAFFLDLDKNDKIKNLSDEDVIYIIEKVIIMLKKYIKESDQDQLLDLFDYIVSKRENKYHVNFYNVIIDGKTNDAQNIIKLAENEMDEKFIGIIDTSVYRTGLRMIGSYKKNETSFYKLYDIKKGEYINMTKELYHKCIVRRKKETHVTFFDESIKTVKRELKKKPKIENIKNKILEEELFKFMKKINNENECFHRYNFDILRVYASLNSSGVFCYYINISDKYCPFKCREHKRDVSPVYVEISMKGVYIKCYDIECIKRKYPVEGVKLPNNMDNEFKELYISMTMKYWDVDLHMTPEIRQVLEDSLSGTHYKIAKAMFTIYKDKFRVDEMKNSEWYIFNNVRWEKTLTLNILLSEGLPRYYKGMKTINQGNGNTSENLEEGIVNEELLESNVRNQQIDNIISKLENVTFKENIMNQLTLMFKTHDTNFYKNLNNNPYLLGFNNGVYDFHDCKFRNGLIHDYITYSTDYDYIEYDPENVYVKEIYEFLSKIITNEKVRKYLLKVLGKSLMGIPDEKFYFFTGLSGANGKSTLINFLELVLGDYMVSVDTSLLTNKRQNGSNASPDVIRLKGRRIIAFQEPEHNDKIRTGILKQFSGNDSIIARELYKSPISFKIQGTMIMCCNDLPTVTSNDGGTWRRIRVIEFNSRFCENPKKPNEFLIDPNIKAKLNVWKPYFMSILIHYYNLYKLEGMDEPDEVKNSTNRYKTDNDKFNEFFDSNIIENENEIETFKNIYSHLTSWWNSNYSNLKIPDTRELKRALKAKYGNEKEKLVDGEIITGFNIQLKTIYSDDIIDNDY